MPARPNYAPNAPTRIQSLQASGRATETNAFRAENQQEK